MATAVISGRVDESVVRKADVHIRMAGLTPGAIIKSAMVGMLDKVKKEIVTGQVEVKQTFKISKVGTIAGGLVVEGKVHAKDKARVIRDGIVIRTADIGALKRYKDDVKEVVTGMECGLSLVNYNDIQEGDVIETFTEIEVEQKL